MFLRILLLICLLVFTNSLFAQKGLISDEDKPPTLGFMVGIHHSGIQRGSKLPISPFITDLQRGYDLGISLPVASSDVYEGTFEMFYSKFGFKESFYINNTLANSFVDIGSLKLNFLPVNIKLGFPRLKWQLGFGGYAQHAFSMVFRSEELPEANIKELFFEKNTYGFMLRTGVMYDRARLLIDLYNGANDVIIDDVDPNIRYRGIIVSLVYYL